MPDPPAGIGSARLKLAPIGAGTVVCRSYRLTQGYDTFNPGAGDTRFAPISTEAGDPIPTMYCGLDEVVVLLESVFHDIHQATDDRVLYEALLRTWGLAYVRLPRALSLVDLRDPQLGRLDLTRDQLVATSAEHYPCTRQWAGWAHTQTVKSVADGIIWHSRQAELVGHAQAREVFVLFGDRAPHRSGAYPLAGPSVRNLVEGPGRIILDRIAESLDAVIEPAADW